MKQSICQIFGVAVIAILGVFFSASPVFASTVLFANTPSYPSYSNQYTNPLGMSDTGEVWVKYHATTSSVLFNRLRVYMCGLHIGGSTIGGTVGLQVIINGTSTGTVIASSTISVNPSSLFVSTTSAQCYGGTQTTANQYSSLFTLTIDPDYSPGINISTESDIWFRFTSRGNSGKSIYINAENVDLYGSSNLTLYSVNSDYSGWAEHIYTGYYFAANIIGYAGGVDIAVDPDAPPEDYLSSLAEQNCDWYDVSCQIDVWSANFLLNMRDPDFPYSTRDAALDYVFALATSTFPINVYYDLYDVFATTTTSNSLRLIDSSIPPSLPGGGTPIVFDFANSLDFLLYATSGSYGMISPDTDINSSTSDEGETFYDITSPYWTAICAILFFFYIVRRISPFLFGDVKDSMLRQVRYEKRINKYIIKKK